MLHQTLWKSRNLELNCPSDFLTNVLIIMICRWFEPIDGICFFVQTSQCLFPDLSLLSFVDSSCEVINNFHQAHCIFTEIESLTCIVIHIPVRAFLIGSFLWSEHFKVEMEKKFALISCFCVFVRLQLHYFEVVVFHVLVRIENFDVHSMISTVNCQEIILQWLNFFRLVVVFSPLDFLKLPHDFRQLLLIFICYQWMLQYLIGNEFPKENDV